MANSEASLNAQSTSAFTYRLGLLLPFFLLGFFLVLSTGCKGSKKGGDGGEAITGELATPESVWNMESVPKWDWSIREQTETTMRVTSQRPGIIRSMYVFLPNGEHEKGSLPCVLIAEAGTTMLSGIDASPDREPIIKYLERGIAVVTYDLDGRISSPQPSDEEIVAAYKVFRDVSAGLANSKNAFDWVVENLDAVDPAKIYAAGHSSAGALALLYAAHEPRLAGCVAYCPATDMRDTFKGELLDQFAAKINDIRPFVTKASAVTHGSRINCPLFIFAARDDTVARFKSIEAFVLTLNNSTNQSTTMDVVNIGGHADGYLREGLDRGVDWIAKQAYGDDSPEFETDEDIRVQQRDEVRKKAEDADIVARLATLKKVDDQKKLVEQTRLDLEALYPHFTLPGNFNSMAISRDGKFAAAWSTRNSIGIGSPTNEKRDLQGIVMVADLDSGELTELKINDAVFHAVLDGEQIFLNGSEMPNVEIFNHQSGELTGTISRTRQQERLVLHSRYLQIGNDFIDLTALEEPPFKPHVFYQTTVTQLLHYDDMENGIKLPGEVPAYNEIPSGFDKIGKPAELAIALLENHLHDRKKGVMTPLIEKAGCASPWCGSHIRSDRINDQDRYQYGYEVGFSIVDLKDFQTTDLSDDSRIHNVTLFKSLSRKPIPTTSASKIAIAKQRLCVMHLNRLFVKDIEEFSLSDLSNLDMDQMMPLLIEDKTDHEVVLKATGNTGEVTFELLTEIKGVTLEPNGKLTIDSGVLTSSCEKRLTQAGNRKQQYDDAFRILKQCYERKSDELNTAAGHPVEGLPMIVDLKIRLTEGDKQSLEHLPLVVTIDDKVVKQVATKLQKRIDAEAKNNRDR